MPSVAVGDGVEIAYFEQGEGPLVVLASYWSHHPSVWDNITAELARDHKVVRYDDRGTGSSTRTGPYDLDTAAADLAAVIEQVGGPAVVLGTGDGANRGARAATARPELIEALIGVGGVPMGRRAFAEMEVLAASEGVVEALLAQIETDYKGVLRGILRDTNPQFSEDELRARIDAQVEHVPQEVASVRLHEWARDDPIEHSRRLGARLWVLVSENMAGGWFPSGRPLAEIVSRELPEANVVEVSDGMVSRPDETATVVRGIFAERAVEAAE